MLIPLKCQCGRTLKIKEHLAGKKVRCPICQNILVVPRIERNSANQPVALMEEDSTPESPPPMNPAPAPNTAFRPQGAPQPLPTGPFPQQAAPPSQGQGPLPPTPPGQGPFPLQGTPPPAYPPGLSQPSGFPPPMMNPQPGLGPGYHNDPWTPESSPNYIPEGPKPRKRRKKKRQSESEYSGISVNPGILAGLGMMAGAVIWFVVGLAAGWIFFYPPVLFVLGIVAVVRGFMGAD